MSTVVADDAAAGPAAELLKNGGKPISVAPVQGAHPRDVTVVKNALGQQFLA